jgi:glycosyltransferase involved in cell wall biosynthesis
MRILKTTQTYYPYLSKGGPPVKVRGMARALVTRGHQVTVLTADLGDPNGAADADASLRRKTVWGWESNSDGVEAIYLRSLANYRATTINPNVLNFWVRRLRQYDVVHIYGLYDSLGAVTGWFCRRSGIPYVLEPLGMFGPKIRSQQKKRLYGRLIGNGLFRGAEAVIATSENERSGLIVSGMNPERILLRRNGLDLSEFQDLPSRGAFRRRLNIAEKMPLVLFIGRLSFIKGLDLLVEAFSQITSDARLVIAGPDDGDGCLESIQRSIAERNLEGRVFLPGPLFRKEKLEALVDADLFVLPSRHESFGNAAAEAIACGTPVLVTRECGIAPLIDGRAGEVVACEVETLRDGLVRLLGDETLLTRLRAGCDELAQSLSWDEPVRMMEGLYASLISPSFANSQVGKGASLV